MDWLANIFLWAGLFFLGYKNRSGFIYLMIGEIIWVVVSLQIGLYSLSVSHAVFFLFSWRNWRLWRPVVDNSYPWVVPPNELVRILEGFASYEKDIRTEIVEKKDAPPINECVGEYRCVSQRPIVRDGAVKVELTWERLM